ncbi:MAG: hypothetical protein G01um101419_298 [Parcubacteria group bacterium Gr01-1014_19]|nr:MAG: hypothetical protein G01um101419_298 [Parcubacteria group bacterium Gr01-1014_19]
MGDEQTIQPDEALTVANAKIAQLDKDLGMEKKENRYHLNWSVGLLITAVITMIAAGTAFDNFLIKKNELKTAQERLTWETERSERLEEFGKNAVKKAQEYYLKAGGDVKCTIWDAEKQAFVEPEKMPIKPGGRRMYVTETYRVPSENSKPTSEVQGVRCLSGADAMKYLFGDHCFETALSDSSKIQPLLEEIKRYELMIIPLEKADMQMYFLFRDGKVEYSGSGAKSELNERVSRNFLFLLENGGAKALERKQPEAIEVPPAPKQAEGEEYNFTPQIEMTIFNSMSQDDAQKMLKVLNEQKRQYQAELNKLYREKLDLEKRLK